jgi:hypothetical protein
MTHDELIPRLSASLKSLADSLTFRYPETDADTVTDSDNAIADAEGETGWSLPLTDKTQIRWFLDRCRRHLLNYLLLDKAMKFQAKSFSLQQQWEHLRDMVAELDAKWQEFKANEDMTGLEAAEMFGVAIGTGLTYDGFGNETIGEPSLWPGDIV